MKINYHLAHQPTLVESIIVPSINTTIRRVRERIAEAYQVDDKAFHMYYLDHQLEDNKTLNQCAFRNEGIIVLIPITYNHNHDQDTENRVTVKAMKPMSSHIAKNSRLMEKARHSLVHSHAQETKQEFRRSRLTPVTPRRPGPLKDVKQEPSELSLSPLKERRPTLCHEPKQERPMPTLSTVAKPAERLGMRFVGPIPRVPVGTTWAKRLDVSYAGVHRPTMAGISGQAEVGAESVVISGGYTDDDDMGFEFTYTGAGGNHGGKQTRDQELTRANHGLAMTCDCSINTVRGGIARDWRKSRPIRVVRGAHFMNIYAPQAGYRYDGIYKVVKYWPETGKAGFRIWRYLMRRDDPEPAPWTIQTVSLPPETPVRETAEHGAYTSHPLGSAARESSSSKPLYGHSHQEVVDSSVLLMNAPVSQYQTHNGNWIRVEEKKMYEDGSIHQEVRVEEDSKAQKSQISAIGTPADDTGIGDEAAGSGSSAGVGHSSEQRVKVEDQGYVFPAWLQTDRPTDQLLEDWM